MHVATWFALDDELKKIAADLTAAGRDKIKSKNFAEPGKRKYPIEDPAHARNALARVSQFGSSGEKAQVRAKVHAKYPGIGKEAGKRDLITGGLGMAAGLGIGGGAGHLIGHSQGRRKGMQQGVHAALDFADKVERARKAKEKESGASGAAIGAVMGSQLKHFVGTHAPGASHALRKLHAGDRGIAGLYGAGMGGLSGSLAEEGVMALARRMNRSKKQEK